MMLECLICNSKLTEAFENLYCSFLICDKCFIQAFYKYQDNSYRRVSLIGNSLPQKTKSHHKKLSQFVISQQIPSSTIFENRLMQQYQKYMIQKTEYQELSTQGSLNNSQREYLKQDSLDMYSQYNWVKDKIIQKIETNFTNIKDSKIVGMVAEGVRPARERVIEKGNQIFMGFQYVKKEINALKREAPVLQEIKKIDIGGFVKSRYKAFF